MKRLSIALLCLLLAGVCACGRAGKSDPYSKVIKEYQGYRETYYYALHDIDGNGTEELLLGGEQWGGEVDLLGVYTIQSGVAVPQEEFNIWGEGGSISPSWIFKNGTIKVDLNNEEPRYNYYCFVDEELKLQATLIKQLQVFDWDNQVYYDEFFRVSENGEWPGTSLTKEEFEQAMKELEGDGQVVVIDWKPLAEYER